jgi:hypothetical protein
VQQNSPPSPAYNPPIYHRRKTFDAKAIVYVVAIGSSIIIAIATLLVTIGIPTWKAKNNASLKRVQVTRHGSTKLPDYANDTMQWVQDDQGTRHFWS